MKRVALIVAAALLSPAAANAQLEQPSIAVVRPGAGYLVADGRSRIPLHIVVLSGASGPRVKRPRIVASEGRVTGVRIIGDDRVEMLYTPPARSSAVDEILDISLTMSNGNRISEAFTLLIPPPRPPALELEASPDKMNVSSPSDVGVAATTRGENVERLELWADAGDLAPAYADGDDAQLSVQTTLALPQLPPDAPSHIIVLAAASSATGYAVQQSGVSLLAPVRVSVEIEPGSELAVEGAEIEQEPVTALADGRTVMEDVIVRYGKRVRAYEVIEGERRELSVILPTGLVSLGTAMPLPGQNVADGGVGPSIVVAIPPAPFGGDPYWPEIAIEGARLVATDDLSPTMKVLVLERPTEAKAIRVLLDEEAIGEVEFGAALGNSMSVQRVALDRDERAAIAIEVKDASGNPTNHPVPKVRIEGGAVLEPVRTGVGRYRASIPPGTPGAPGATLDVYAELPPAPKVAGEALELVRETTSVELSGAPPAVKSKEEPKEVELPSTRRRAGLSPKFGASGAALIGASFDSLLMIGGGFMAELRLPFVAHRIAVRAGLELSYGSTTGRLVVGDSRLETKTAISGLILPIDFGFAVVHTDAFELLVRAGVAVRVEQGGISVGGNDLGGGSNVGIGGRATVEGALNVGDGALFLAATLSGLGASANGLSAPGGTQFDGNLTNVRAELGYRIWF